MALADVCLEWNIYRKSVTAVVSNKTIITEDPDTNEANDLKNVEYTHSTEQINTINTIDLPNCKLYCYLSFLTQNFKFIIFSYLDNI